MSENKYENIEIDISMEELEKICHAILMTHTEDYQIAKSILEDNGKEDLVKALGEAMINDFIVGAVKSKIK